MPSNVTKNYYCVAAIAGSDSSGGAGIQADLKAIAATGGFAATMITAITAQNTQGVQAVHPLPPDIISAQIDSVFNDLTIRAVKIGMLHNPGIIAAVAAALKKYQPRNIVLDPVMIAQSGQSLLLPESLTALKTLLFPLATLLTPNLPEAEALLATSIATPKEMENAAQTLGARYQTNVLMKGGHFTTQHHSADILYSHPQQQCRWFCAERIVTPHTHGTGCTLSAAIASYLAQDYPLIDAVQAAKNYLSAALQAGKFYQLGKGAGPVQHFYHLPCP